MFIFAAFVLSSEYFEASTAVVFPNGPQSVSFNGISSSDAFGAYFPQAGQLTQTDESIPLNAVTALIPGKCRRLTVSTDEDRTFVLRQTTLADSCLFFVGKPSRIDFEVVSNVTLMNQLHVESVDGNVPNIESKGYGKWNMEFESSILVRWSLKMATTEHPEVRIRISPMTNSIPYPAATYWFDISEVPVAFEEMNDEPPLSEPAPSVEIQLHRYENAWDQFTHEGPFQWLQYVGQDWFIATVAMTLAISALFGIFHRMRLGARRPARQSPLMRGESDAIPPVVAGRAHYQPQYPGAVPVRW